MNETYNLDNNLNLSYCIHWKQQLCASEAEQVPMTEEEVEKRLRFAIANGNSKTLAILDEVLGTKRILSSNLAHQISSLQRQELWSRLSEV